MKIHFIGIGGIGVSALAQYYKYKGHDVSGSDLVSSEITDFMKKKGAKVFIGPHKEKNVPRDVDMVIYSPAVEKDNLELKQAKKLGIKTQTYPEALGELTKRYYTIAIAGAHGKSTTTAMMALVLMEAGLDPTVVVGTKVKEFRDPALSEAEGTNFRMGRSKYLVIEACEYDSSFLHYQPKIIAVTNIDKEHLDYFKTFANVKKAFYKFIKKLPKGGYLAVNLDDKNLKKFKSGYSLSQPEAKKIKKILQVPGVHNVSNALAVLSVARFLKIPDKTTFKALSKFKGTWRRFEESELKITRQQAELVPNRKLKIINDYAHHPNEIKATLAAAREKYPDKKIICVFQPHQYQRTYSLFNDFVKILRQAQDNHLVDKMIVTDIYSVAGRESDKIKKKVNSEKLVKKIGRKNVIYIKEGELEDFLAGNLKGGEVLIIMGAGDIYKLAGVLTNILGVIH